MSVREVRIATPIFEHDERIVWGLTARILEQFRDAWNDPHSPLRKNIEASLLSP